jgi:hypothetical protein
MTSVPCSHDVLYFCHSGTNMAVFCYGLMTGEAMTEEEDLHIYEVLSKSFRTESTNKQQ